MTAEAGATPTADWRPVMRDAWAAFGDENFSFFWNDTFVIVNTARCRHAFDEGLTRRWPSEQCEFEA